MSWIMAVLGLVSAFGAMYATSVQSSANDKAAEIEKEGFDKQYEIAQQNLDLQKQTADKNFGLMEKAFAMQQQENQITRDREDNAYQRQVADLKAAGLSPLMVSGGSPASALSVGSAPQYDATGISNAYGNIGAVMGNLFKTKAQREQLKAGLRANVIAALSNAPINVANAYYGAKEQQYRLDILKAESGYYNEHGYKPTSFNELLSDFLKGVAGGEVASPNNFYNFGNWISGKTKEHGSKVLDLLNENDKPNSEESSKPKVHSYYQNQKVPSKALKDTTLSLSEVVNMARLWTFTFRDSTKKKIAPVLGEYYDKMPALHKTISKEQFIKSFTSRQKYLATLLWGSDS